MPRASERIWAPAFVTVVTTVGMSLGLPMLTTACDDKGDSPQNGELANWDEVESGHPEGATNPPTPTLVVDRDGSKCGKGFFGGIGGIPKDTFQLTIADKMFHTRWRTDKRRGVAIHCPKGTAEAVKAHLSNQAAAKKKPSPWDDEPELQPRPKLRKAISKTNAKEGLVVVARQFVTNLTTADEVGLSLSFHGDKGGLSYKEGIGAQKVRWIETFDKLQVTLTGPDGEKRTLRAAGKSTSTEKPTPLAMQWGHEVKIGDAGIAEERFQRNAPWAAAGKPLLAKPGRYTVTVAGSLGLESGPVAFETGELVFEVKDATEQAPLKEIEAKAIAYVKAKQPGMREAPRMTLPTMEDEPGNRVVRFALDGEGYDIGFTELVLDAKGKVLSAVQQQIFRCIAEGVTITTPAGPRRVEELSIGDEVVAFDVEKTQHVVTRVEAIWRSYSDQLLSLTAGLVVSERHPIYANGQWMEARFVPVGASLISLDGGLNMAAPQRQAAGGIVYDLSVGWPHTYFAGGSLVHNKAAESKGAHAMRTDLDFRPTRSAPAPAGKSGRLRGEP